MGCFKITTKKDCPNCGQEIEFEFGWSNDDITCPNCGVVLEVEYDIDYDENVSGPWLWIK